MLNSPLYTKPNIPKNTDVMSWGIVLLVLIAIVCCSSLVAALREDATAPPRPKRVRIQSNRYGLDGIETIVPGDRVPDPVVLSHIPHPTIVPRDPVFASSVPPLDMGLFPGRREFQADLYIPK